MNDLLPGDLLTQHDEYVLLLNSYQTIVFQDAYPQEYLDAASYNVGPPFFVVGTRIGKHKKGYEHQFCT